MLEGMGTEGQERLLASSVLLVGAGALGSVVAMYLAASGVGCIGIADFDTIDISNLQRQLTFTEADLGRSKAQVTAEKLKAMNSDVQIVVYEKLLRRTDLENLLSQYDLVIEGSDNPDTKYMVTNTCAMHGKPYVIGGVAQYNGQVMCYVDGTKRYEEVFPRGDESADFLPCSMGGVLGPLPGVVGSLMSVEAIKLLTGIGEPLTNRLLLIDALTMKITTLRLKPCN
jgi:molybdopterin/thiamine biosynthesis adenylyltransferase